MNVKRCVQQTPNTSSLLKIEFSKVCSVTVCIFRLGSTGLVILMDGGYNIIPSVCRVNARIMRLTDLGFRR